jgi:glycosyltransferase involved in cell wall biosynthesis
VGKFVSEYEELLKNTGITYEYKSGLSEQEMLQEYIDADIVTLASTYEGFGMPILEAQATGRPVVTSNIFSMPEVAGNAAYLADPYDVSSIRNGFLKIIGDENYRTSLVNGGFSNVERFDANSISHQYFELYKELAGNKTKA